MTRSNKNLKLRKNTTQDALQTSQVRDSEVDSSSSCEILPVTREYIQDVWHNQTEPLDQDPKFNELGRKFEKEIYTRMIKVFDSKDGIITGHQIFDYLSEIAFQDETVIRMIGRRRLHRMPLPKVIVALIEIYYQKMLAVLEIIHKVKVLPKASLEPAPQGALMKQIALNFVHHIWDTEVEHPVHDLKFDELGKKLTEAVCSRVRNDCNGIESDEDLFEVLECLALKDKVVKEMMDKSNTSSLPPLVYSLVMKFVKRKCDLAKVMAGYCRQIGYSASEHPSGTPEPPTISGVSEPSATPRAPLEPAPQGALMKQVTSDFVQKVWDTKMKHPVHDPKFDKLVKNLREATFMRATQILNQENIESLECFEVRLFGFAEEDVNLQAICADKKITYASSQEISKSINELLTYYCKMLPALVAKVKKCDDRPEDITLPGATDKARLSAITKSQRALNKGASRNCPTTRDGSSEPVTSSATPKAPREQNLVEQPTPSAPPKPPITASGSSRPSEPSATPKAHPKQNLVKQPTPSATTKSLNKESASKRADDHKNPVSIDLVREIWNNQIFRPTYDPKLETLCKNFQEAILMRVTMHLHSCPIRQHHIELVPIMRRLASQDEHVKKMIAGGKGTIEQGLPMKIHEMIVDHLNMMTQLIQKIVAKTDPALPRCAASSVTSKPLKPFTCSFIPPKIQVTTQFVEDVWNTAITPPVFDPKLSNLVKKLRDEMVMIVTKAINNSVPVIEEHELSNLFSIGTDDEITEKMLADKKEPLSVGGSMPLKVFNLVVFHFEKVPELVWKVRNKIILGSTQGNSNLVVSNKPRVLINHEAREVNVSTDKPNQEGQTSDELVKAKPKPKLKKQPSDATSSTTSVKPPARPVKPSRLSRQMLKLLGRTREIKARNYRPDAPYHKRRCSRRALAPREQEESAACKKCWRMSKRLTINRKIRRNAVIVLEKFRGKAMRYDELEKKLEEKDGRIAELEKNSIDNSRLELELKELKEYLKEKDGKIAELERIPKVDDKKLTQKVAELEQKLEESQEKVRKLEAEQTKSDNSVKPSASSTPSQTTPPESKNPPVLKEQEAARTHGDQTDIMNKMMEEMGSMRRIMEQNQKEIENFKRAPPTPTITNTDATISLLKEQKEILVKQTVEKDVELCKLNLELEKFRAAGMTYAEVEALKESKIEFMKEIEDLRKDNAITKEINTRHENTIRELVAINFEQ